MTWLPHEPLVDRERAVALGVFDGIHIGHRAVISAAWGIEGQTPCVLSLVGVPKAGERLTADVDSLCETLGVAEWLSLPFESVRDMSPEQFVQEILQEKLHAKTVCCGYNYRFGKGGVGTVDTLMRLCEAFDIDVKVIPAVEVDGIPVSSTRIRTLLKKGDMLTVMRLLGRPFTISGTVTRGNRRGHTWGFPTINQVLEDGVALPRFGVYASLVILDGKLHFAVTNIGTHPTVGTVDRPQAETFIDGFEGDLYGQTVTVELIRHLRDEQSFASVEQLKEQIDRDRNEAFDLLSGRAHTARAVLFDLDDTLQNCTAAFTLTVRDVIRHHFPDLSKEERASLAETILGKEDIDYRSPPHFPAFFANDNVSAKELNEEATRQYLVRTSWFKRSERILNHLRENDYLVGIVTNGERLLQNRKLDLSGFRPLCDTIAVSGDEGVHKPDPELFRRVAARLCAAPCDCKFIGDNPNTDIAGALAAGMNPVFLNTSGLRDQLPSPSPFPILFVPEDIVFLL